MNKLKSCSPKDAFYQGTFLFNNISLGKRHDAFYEQTWIPVTQEFFVQSLVEIGTVVYEEKFLILAILFMCFRYFVIISPWK